MQPIRKERASGAPSPSPASSSFPAISCFPPCRRQSSRRRRFAIPICLGVAFLAALRACPADAGTAPASAPSALERGDPFAAWIAEAARRFDIPASWIRDVMRIESRGDASAVSAQGAIGLMQLMPETWADLRLRYSLEETGLPHHPSSEGEYVSGAYRQRVTLASGRFAMIDDGLGFQFVPWRPAFEQQLGRHFAGVMMPEGRVDWDFGRSRDLGL